MHPALLILTRLQLGAALRRMFRGVKTVRGAIFFIIGCIVFISWLSGTLLGVAMLKREDPQRVLLYFPLGMLAFCLMTLITSAGERAVAFSPAEVDFLFPGPFSRRQLLGYKILRSSFAAVFTGLLFSFVFLRFTSHWICGWIGIFLALVFIQMLSMAIVLVGQTIGERAYTRGRKIALLVIAIFIAAILLPHALHPQALHADQIVRDVTQSTPGRAVLWPFSVFARIITANPMFPNIAVWSVVAIAMDVALIFIVLGLDSHYLESAASAGQQRYERMQRFRRGGGMAFRAGSARLRLPMLPRFAGAGAIAWRQLLTALRTAKAILMVQIVIAVLVGPVLFFGGSHNRPENLLIGVLCWFTFMLSNMLRFDFRGDLDHIDTLRSLPARRSAIAIAQLIAPVVVLTLYQLIVVLSVGAALKTPATKLALAMLFAVPINALLIGVENLIFLLFPVRAVAVSPGDLQGFGRQMIVLLLKVLSLLTLAGLAGGVGAALWWIGDRSIALLVAGAFITLCLEIAGMIPLLAISFERFDPSVDTPT